MSTSGEVMMDLKVVEMVANAAAERAAHQAASGVMLEARTEIAEQFGAFKQEFFNEVEQRFSAYFGEQRPSDHIIQHDRLKRGIEWYDGLIGSLANKLVMGTIVAVAVLAGGVWVAGKLFGVL